MIGKLIDLAEYTDGTIVVFDQNDKKAVLEYEDKFVVYRYEDDNWEVDN